jgi:MFS family permease
MISATGTRSAQAVLVLPLQGQFGFAAGPVVSAAIALGIALGGLSSPFVTALNQKWGVRRTVPAILFLNGVSCALSASASAVWQLVPLWGFGMGLGFGNVGAIVVTRWFETHRGFVFGIFSAAGASGSLLFLPLLARVATFSGWRPCLLLVAGISLILAPVFAIVVRNHPSDMNLRPFGAQMDTAVQQQPNVNALALALRELGSCFRNRPFWVLAGTFFVCGASTNGLVGVHLIPYCGDHGIPETRAAGLLVTMGLFDLVGTTASGWLSDRLDNRRLLALYYGLRGLSLLFLPVAFGVGALALPAFAVFYGLDWIATVPPTMKLSIGAFGAARAPVIFAWILAAHQLGAAVAAFAAGVIRLLFGSYDGAFIASGALCMVAAMLVLQMADVRERAAVPAPAT